MNKKHLIYYSYIQYIQNNYQNYISVASLSNFYPRLESALYPRRLRLHVMSRCIVFFFFNIDPKNYSQY